LREVPRARVPPAQEALPRVALHYALKADAARAGGHQKYRRRGGSNGSRDDGRKVQLGERLGMRPRVHTHPSNQRERDIRNAVEFGVRTFVADKPR